MKFTVSIYRMSIALPNRGYCENDGVENQEGYIEARCGEVFGSHGQYTIFVRARGKLSEVVPV